MRHQVETESNPEVLSTTLVAWCELGEADVVDDVAPYLDHEVPEVRKGAIVGLLRSGGIDGILLAGRYLLKLEQSSDPDQRAFIAQVLGDVGIRSFYHPLLKLLRDPNSDVRREAIIAAGKVKSPRLWPQVIQNLMEFSFHSTAISAFVTAGEEALPILATTLESPDASSDYQIRIAQVLGRIKGPGTTDVLERHLNTPNGSVRSQILKALHQCNYRAENIAVIQYVRTEVENSTKLLACLADIGTDSTLNQVRRALFEEIDQSRQRCFYLLSFLYDAATILRAQENLHHKAPQQKAYALEVLHTTLAHELSALILPLCESITSAQRLKQLREHFPQQSMSCQERLRHVALQTDRWLSSWLRANALYNLTDHTDFIAVLFDRDEPLRETAIGMLFRTAPEIYQQYAAALKQDPNIRISRAPQNLERWAKGGQSVLLTIEKVMVLKSVDIFAHVFRRRTGQPGTTPERN